jgi:hypothetical protein
MMTNKTNTYLAVWDCYGLESLFNMTEWSAKATYNSLMELAPPPNIPFNELMMRARFNPQRNYEIYTFSVENDVSEEELTEAFKVNPQFIVEHIRKNGQKMWSDRISDKEKRVIE